MPEVNRKQVPEFTLIEHIEFIKANEKRLDNNIPVYAINSGTQDLIKIEFLFEAGMFQQIMPLQASAVNTMLEEGTSKLTAAQIADKLDYYGAFFETGITQDYASLILYSLNKHIPELLPIVEQIINDAVFPQNELDIHLKNKKQQFLVNNQKVATLARKHFSELLFGSNHPYGINVKESDFNNITREVLIEFYNRFYNAENCKIIVAGKVNDNLHSLLNKHFGGVSTKKSNGIDTIVKYSKNKLIPITTTSQNYHVIEKKDAMQSAIRVGKVLFNKTNHDYQAMQVLNTVLGGYFGSRLMTNIREDKGYTYGIGSGIVSLKNSGYFFISTEVGVDVCNSALNEIYFEINRLREEMISQEELELVKNFMMGNFLRSIDGPFAMAERFKGIMEYGLDYDYFDRYIATIKNISTSQLIELANKYLTKESMVELVVGKK